MQSHTIPLQHPVEVDGEIISSIAIRPPTAEDVAAVRFLNVSKFIRGMRLIERVVDAPRDVLFKLDAVDQKKIDDFFREHGV